VGEATSLIIAVVVPLQYLMVNTHTTTGSSSFGE